MIIITSTNYIYLKAVHVTQIVTVEKIVNVVPNQRKSQVAVSLDAHADHIVNVKIANVVNKR